MSIEAIASASGATLAGTGSAREVKQTMDSEVFMQLLVTQLRNQDPSSPMDTTDMVAQTTQLAMMESLTKLTAGVEGLLSSQQSTQASQLIGATVTWTDASGESRSGTVESVSFGAAPTVSVDGTDVALSEITGASLPGSGGTTA
jgi:flagellar basal-body rod modification protein FlgD